MDRYLTMKTPKLIEIHDLDLSNFQSFIEDRISLIENQALNDFNSMTKYHETIIDIGDELKIHIQNKQNEILNQIDTFYEYYFKLSETLNQITQKINYHENELNKFKNKIDLNEIGDLFTTFRNKNNKPESKQSSLNIILCNLRHMLIYMANENIVDVTTTDEAIKERLLTSWFKYKFVDLFKSITI